MKFTKTDKLGLMISCPIFMFIGIPFAASGWVAGIALIFFGMTNLLLGIFIPADDRRENDE
jgi:hypothetical protein